MNCANQKELFLETGLVQNGLKQKPGIYQIHTVHLALKLLRPFSTILRRFYTSLKEAIFLIHTVYFGLKSLRPK